MVPFGGVDAGWKPGGSRIGEKSSLLSDDSAVSSSEDMSTTAGCKEVTCMRRAYANSLQIGVASMIHAFRAFCSTCGGGLPNTIRVFSSGVKDAKLVAPPLLLGSVCVLLCFSGLNQWLCNLPELHVFGGIQYSFLLQEALNFSNII